MIVGERVEIKQKTISKMGCLAIYKGFVYPFLIRNNFEELGFKKTFGGAVSNAPQTSQSSWWCLFGGLLGLFVTSSQSDQAGSRLTKSTWCFLIFLLKSQGRELEISSMDFSGSCKGW